MIYLLLIYEFSKIGLFAVGGGYSTLPFLYHLSEQYGWFSSKELVDMLAVSSITPGPVGINVATYAGVNTAGIVGAFVATAALILPSFFIVIIVYKLLKKFSDNFYTQAILYSIKPAGCALIAAVVARLFDDYVLISSVSFDWQHILSFVDLKALFLLVALLIMSIKVKKNPLIYLGVAAVCGILLNLK